MIRKNVWARAAIVAAAGALLLAVALGLLQRDEAARYRETRGTMTEGFGQLKTVTVDGVTYQEKPAVMTMLIAGIDRPIETEEAEKDGATLNYRDGGQADFLLLLAIDHTEKKIHQLQIDRDTMCEIDILGVFGNEAGQRTAQICLAHRYGATAKDNAKYTLRAVERLLDGVQIDGYYMMDYGAIGELNDALGGITVNVDFDMTNVNALWTAGSRVTLHGKEAEDFVRSRMTVGEGTNVERMARQNEFMKNAIATMKQKTRSDLSFGENLLRQMEKKSVTNMTVRWLAEELSQSADYETGAVEYLPGEHRIGPEGYMEFHMEDGAAAAWVLEHLYTRKAEE